MYSADEIELKRQAALALKNRKMEERRKAQDKSTDEKKSTIPCLGDKGNNFVPFSCKIPR